MASTVAGRALTEAHRKQQLAIGAQVQQVMLAIFPLWNWDDLDGTWLPFREAMLAVIESGFALSSRRAAAYYRSHRIVEGVAGDIVPHAPQFNRSRAAANMELLGPIMAKKTLAVRKPDARAVATVRLLGGTQRMALLGGRETVETTLKQDPKAKGYVRILTGPGCQFCRSLEGAHSSSDPFPAHSHCSCTSEPAF